MTKNEIIAQIAASSCYTTFAQGAKASPAIASSTGKRK